MNWTVEQMKESTIEKLYGFYKPDPNCDPYSEWKMIHEPSLNTPIIDDDFVESDESDY